MSAIRPKLLPAILFSILLAASARSQELDLVGNVSWDQFGRGIRIFAESVENNRSSGVSGFLRLQVWATEEPYDGVSEISGYILGTFNLGYLPAGSLFANAARTVRFFRPD